MGGILALLYGVVCYLSFLGTFLYLIGFLWGVGVPKGIDDGVATPLGEALAVDLALLAAFALQHTVMARANFKEKWTKIVPPSVERSTYVLATNLVLAFIFWQWRPLPEVLWRAESEALFAGLRTVSAAGFLGVVAVSYMINHFDLFGLRQVWLRFKNEPYTPLEFQTRWFYKWVRHPLMTCMLVGIWAAPLVTQGYLLLALGMTGYILVGTRIEERSLRAHLGEPYNDYARRVPMFVPIPKKSG